MNASNHQSSSLNPISNAKAAFDASVSAGDSFWIAVDKAEAVLKGFYKVKSELNYSYSSPGCPLRSVSLCYFEGAEFRSVEFEAYGL